MASDDLTARLLARTEELARTGKPAQHTGCPPAVPAARGFRPALRAAVLVAGGAAAAAALLGGSAYLMGGDPAPLAGGTPASAFLQRDLAASAPAAAEAAPGPPAGWSLTGEPDFTPAGALTAAQLATLRSEGWTCPELRELGYHLVWARGGVLAGVDIVELRLTDGRNFATILEQHGEPARAVRHAGRCGPLPPAPVNVLTGRPATSDGFTTATFRPVLRRPQRRRGRAAGSCGSTMLPPSRPSTSPAMPPSPTSRTSPRSRPTTAWPPWCAPAPLSPGAAAGDAAGTGAGHNVTARLERGLGRILELLAP